MHHFNISHLTLTFQNSVFAGIFLKVMQNLHLESVMWDGVGEVLVIILFPRQTLYQL